MESFDCARVNQLDDNHADRLGRRFRATAVIAHCHSLPVDCLELPFVMHNTSGNRHTIIYIPNGSGFRSIPAGSFHPDPIRKLPFRNFPLKRDIISNMKAKITMNGVKGNRASRFFSRNLIGLLCRKETTIMKNARKGFSIMETMLGLFGLILLSFISNAYMMTFMKTNTSIKEISQATAASNTVMEKLRLKNYTALIDGSDTVNNKYKCSWTVTPQANSSRKLISLSVQWPLSGSGKIHNIQVSTIRAQ
jgi:hypothetical protein